MMISRLKQLRDALGLSKSKFAQTLNLDGSYFSKIESRKKELNDRIIQLVCLTHNVDERWLRTGEGEMFSAEKATPSVPSKREIVVQYILDVAEELSLSNRQILLEAARKLASKYPREEHKEND